VILDNHRSSAGDGPEENGLWYTNDYPESAWINDWTMLAKRYQGVKDANGKAVVVGMDLRNEPHLNPNGSPGTGACWTGDPAKGGCSEDDAAHNWPKAAERAGNVILKADSNLLIFVEGVDCYDNDCGWWGGNLEGVANHPVELSVQGRLVYSPHDFGPSLYQQKWFNGATTQASLYGVWDKYFGYIYNAGTAPLWVGEFGTGDVPAIQVAFEEFDRVLGIISLRRAEEQQPSVPISEIERLIEDRHAARRRRDFAAADRIRNDLAARGVLLEDGAGGTRWKRK
jgi:endoglucanase